MATISKVVRTLVENSINNDYLEACVNLTGHKSNLKDVYLSEYGYNGLTPKACKEYLQGLPDVCTIPFYNGEILELLEQHGITRKTEAGQNRLIEAYWNEAGYQFYKMVKGL